MRRLFSIVIGLVCVAYPIFVYMGISRFSPWQIAGGVLALLIVRAVVSLRFSIKKIKSLLPLTIAAAVPALVALLWNTALGLLLMPVAVNLVLLLLFSVSLVRSPSMIERFASLQLQQITPNIRLYCQKVTLVWCGFFVVNGSIAAYTVFYTSKEYWTLYNGLISYILMGLLFGGEYIVRKRVQNKNGS